MTTPMSATVPAPKAWKPYLALFSLYLLNTLLVLDKIVFTILVEPVKAEFGLDDFQVGLLTGSVYAVCLGVASLPLGMLVDRSSRRNIAAGCLAFWSAMTALCGMAQSYTTLLAARLGVGIGEAGGGPASLSMIADLFDHRRRATAMAIFALGTPTAGLLNLTINTNLAHTYGWRFALFAASVPGLVLAITMRLFIAEPERATGTGGVPPKAASFSQTFHFIRTQRSLVHFLIGGAVAYIVLAGVSSWSFSFLIRVHHVKLHEVGPILGVAIAISGLFGLFLSGRLADVLSRRDERWRTWVMTITTLMSVCFGTATFSVGSWQAAVIGMAGFATTATLWLAPGYALSQSLVPARMRGMIGAIVFMLANVLGYGLGPALVGLLSDLLAPVYGTLAIRTALIGTVSLNLWAAFHFMLGARTLRADLDVAGLEQQQ
ncbi:MFS transporter [Novosphingobium sp. PP1Y]|uniref:MFS transporter n=1 Tax=Novosphingobium sp. PP1Y TaxID=702113 RepID=UPI00020EFB4B|nr:MFS transporter [Novosphingobium sp. PP1Y]CCA90041.1 major facilitator transporter [Novosphingobium sp. PP1Y]